MKKIMTITLLTSTILLANNLNKDDIQKNLLMIEKEKNHLNIIDSKLIKSNIINDVNIEYNNGRTYYDNNNDLDTNNLSISFEQDIFQSGGIYYSIQSSKLYENVSNINYKINLLNIYKNIFDIKSNYEITNLEIKKNLLNNKYLKLEKDILEEDYKAGIGSFLDINNKIISFNNNLIENSNLNNTLEEFEKQFKIYSIKNINEFKYPTLKKVKIEDYFKQLNSQLLEEEYKYSSKLIDLEKTKYLPKLSVYANHNNNFEDNTDNNSIGFKLKLPIKLTKNYDVEKRKVENLKKKLEINENNRKDNIEYSIIENKIKNFDKTINLLNKISNNWLINLNTKKEELNAEIITSKQYDLFKYQYEISKMNINIEELKKTQYINNNFLEFYFNKVKI